MLKPQFHQRDDGQAVCYFLIGSIFTTRYLCNVYLPRNLAGYDEVVIQPISRLNDKASFWGRSSDFRLRAGPVDGAKDCPRKVMTPVFHDTKNLQGNKTSLLKCSYSNYDKKKLFLNLGNVGAYFSVKIHRLIGKTMLTKLHTRRGNVSKAIQTIYMRWCFWSISFCAQPLRNEIGFMRKITLIG